MDVINSVKEFFLGHGLENFVSDWGLLGIAFCVFGETAFFFGFFLPGESLLITAGIFAANGTLNVWEVCAVVFIASTLGCQVGYEFGRWVGPAFHRREDGRFFKKKHLQKADRYFQRYGNRTVLFLRFIPIVRTFGPLMAGIASMPRRAYTIYNVIGGALWTFSMVLLGYYGGKTLKDHGIDVEKYILPIVLIVVLLSLIPAVIEVRREAKFAEKEEINQDEDEVPAQ